MAVIWHESLYHGGSKSRPDKDNSSKASAILCQFRYVNYQKDPPSRSKRSKLVQETNDDVVHGTGRDLFHDAAIYTYHKYNKSRWEFCWEGTETMIDLRSIEDHQYQSPGDHILGNLNIYMGGKVLEVFKFMIQHMNKLI